MLAFVSLCSQICRNHIYSTLSEIIAGELFFSTFLFYNLILSPHMVYNSGLSGSVFI